LSSRDNQPVVLSEARDPLSSNEKQILRSAQDDRIIDGGVMADRVCAETSKRVDALKQRGITPGLTVVLVGDDAASAVYVGSKEKTCKSLGMKGETIRMSAETTEARLMEVVDALNADPAVHGILVQMPLPKHMNADAVIRRIKPEKDVDGFHPVNVGKLSIGQDDGFIPCTPNGALFMLKESGVPIKGAECVIVGRSNIVGKPMAALMLANDATVTVAHSRTKDLGAVTRRADILIAAVGKPQMITAEMVKPGAVVIDVGINRIADPTKKSGTRLVGDVDFDGVKQVASKITPVPGGVGKMTIAMLMLNTVRAAEMIGR
jgi:methylenetetrahydrofolate dehydrogenase (NADP+) / methenyltetrahydrofolate cyclohydrolase